jgi:NADH-ubiquinone oxidoreductase chain 4
MVLNIKILMIFFFFSFVLLLYKLNKFSRVILIETSDRVLENVEINERHGQPSPVLVNYFSDLLNKRPNLLTYPLLMTTSFIYNKKERINEESYELDHIKQTIELKKLSMSMALLVFLVIGIEWNNLDVFSSAYQKGFSITLPLGIHSGIILGYDHLSIPFILLLSFVFPVVFMSNWTTVKLGEMKYYLTTILSSHYFLIIVFLVIDILMFYISFEIILPFFFILLGMFGGVQKFRAMYYLFLYTLWGSLFMLLEFLTKIGENGTGVMGLLEDLQLSSSWGLLGSIGIILAFSIKTPIVPFHLWLPLAHGDANVSGSIVLASIVLKMALYGFIRILIFILLLAFSSAQLSLFSIFIFSLLFASTTTMRQNDLKVLVAYSSVAHMGSTLLGGFSNNQFGIFGSILFSIAHGVVSPALFIFVGALFYDRIGSRIMNYLKGLVFLYPVAVAMLLPVVFGNMGTPLTANFVAELECILATFMANIPMGILAAVSIILSACYSIYMFNRISTGSISPYLASAPDSNKKEFSMLIPLIIIMILLGITPSLISNPIDLGLSNFLLNGSNSFLNNCVGILSVILNISFIVYIYESIKLIINNIIFRFKYLILKNRNIFDLGLK